MVLLFNMYYENYLILLLIKLLIKWGTLPIIDCLDLLFMDMVHTDDIITSMLDQLNRC
jgi:hypothetical protein